MGLFKEDLEKRNILKERTHRLAYQNRFDYSDEEKKQITLYREELKRTAEHYNDCYIKANVYKLGLDMKFKDYLENKLEVSLMEDENDSTNKEARR